jgi:hypothetical protein
MTTKAPSTTQGFVRLGFYERLAELRETDPRTFASISPASKLALFEYEKQLRQHEQEKEFAK